MLVRHIHNRFGVLLTRAFEMNDTIHAIYDANQTRTEQEVEEQVDAFIEHVLDGKGYIDEFLGIHKLMEDNGLSTPNYQKVAEKMQELLDIFHARLHPFLEIDPIGCSLIFIKRMKTKTAEAKAKQVELQTMNLPDVFEGDPATEVFTLGMQVKASLDCATGLYRTLIQHTPGSEPLLKAMQILEGNLEHTNGGLSIMLQDNKHPAAA